MPRAGASSAALGRPHRSDLRASCLNWPQWPELKCRFSKAVLSPPYANDARLDLASVQLYPNSLSYWKAVAEDEMASRSQHVFPRGGSWAVRRTGSDRVTKLFDTKWEAIVRGREIVQNQGTELYVHGRDGRIRGRYSYEHDPQPPKG